MQDLKRMRGVVTHYRELQGLRMLPWCLWIIAFSAVNPIMGLPQGHLDFQCLIVMPGTLIAWGLSKLIGDYYDRAFGHVKGLAQRSPIREALLTITVLGVTYAALIIDSLQRFPISLVMLIVAGAYLAQWWRSERLFPHRAALAAVLVLLSLAPLTGIPAEGHWFSLAGSFLLPIVLGTALSIGSLLDHIALVRLLKSLPQEAV